MPHYKYLIIGGGMTAAAAIEGIREADTDGAIGLISAESNPPYNRPPLSKGLWKGKSVDDIWREVERRDVALHLGREATALDLANKQVTDDGGTGYTFDRLLLATGGAPRRLPGSDAAGDIIYYRTLDDYVRLRDLADARARFAVIGGGFIGSEIAAALAMRGKDVVMLFPEAGIGAGRFPEDLARNLIDYYREKGVDVRPKALVDGVTRQGDTFIVRARRVDTEQVEEIPVDGVVAGIGIRPNTALAQAAGLVVEDGIVVDERLRTSHPDVFAAGDVAAFYNAALDRRLRVEHEDNANTMGKMAGRNMAGGVARYDYLPYFYSDLFDLGYEAVGEFDATMEMAADWQDPYRKGVVYSLQEGRVRGVLLWNVWDQVDAARQLIAEPGPFTRGDLVGRIPG
ncbi:MAG: NAD(P)/FAD-dependent oxidoreductase [Anaerolineae bacterium]